MDIYVKLAIIFDVQNINAIIGGGGGGLYIF